MIEVERKYLVKNNSYKIQAQRAGLIVQGYLGDNPLSETRIAIEEEIVNDNDSEQDEYSSKEVKFY